MSTSREKRLADFLADQAMRWIAAECPTTGHNPIEIATLAIAAFRQNVVALELSVEALREVLPSLGGTP